MAIAGSEYVTITLNRTTVKTLRRRKRGAPWNAYLLEATNRKCGIECLSCGKWLEAQRTDISQDTLAKNNSWKPMVIYGEKTVGFMCKDCVESG